MITINLLLRQWIRYRKEVAMQRCILMNLTGDIIVDKNFSLFDSEGLEKITFTLMNFLFMTIDEYKPDIFYYLY
jgi:hypothetical protein